MNVKVSNLCKERVLVYVYTELNSNDFFGENVAERRFVIC